MWIQGFLFYHIFNGTSTIKYKLSLCIATFRCIINCKIGRELSRRKVRLNSLQKFTQIIMKIITICLFSTTFFFSYSFAVIAQMRIWEYSNFDTSTFPYPQTHLNNIHSTEGYRVKWKCQELDRELLAKFESQNRHIMLDYTLETVSLISPFIEGGLTLERCLRGYIKQDESAKKIGIIAATALIGAQIVNVLLKYAIDRERPDLGARNYRPRLLNTRLTPSFPSGHAASSFAFANVMGAKYSRYQYPLLGYSVLSGYSQMYVGNHYPSDVFAGALLGYSVGELTLHYQTVIIRTFLFF